MRGMIFSRGAVIYLALAVGFWVEPGFSLWLRIGLWIVNGDCGNQESAFLCEMSIFGLGYLCLLCTETSKIFSGGLERNILLLLRHWLL